MSNPSSRFRPLRRTLPFLPALVLTGALLTDGQSAQAQAVLSLTPLTSTVAVGSTVTFTVDLTGGTNVGAYGFNILLDPTVLSFVGTAPYTNQDSFFTVGVTNTLASPGDLMVNYSLSPGASAGVDNVGPTALGTFQVTVLSALPLTGSTITFAEPGNTITGGSEVDDFNTGNNELLPNPVGATLFTAAPEPSQDAALGIGLLGLSALALTARRRAAARK